jgi:hypothetical protein
VYQAQAQQGQPTDGGGPDATVEEAAAGEAEDVVEADYEIVEDEKG